MLAVAAVVVAPIEGPPLAAPAATPSSINPSLPSIPAPEPAWGETAPSPLRSGELPTPPSPRRVDVPAPEPARGDTAPSRLRSGELPTPASTSRVDVASPRTAAPEPGEGGTVHSPRRPIGPGLESAVRIERLSAEPVATAPVVPRAPIIASAPTVEQRRGVEVTRPTDSDAAAVMATGASASRGTAQLPARDPGEEGPHPAAVSRSFQPLMPAHGEPMPSRQSVPAASAPASARVSAAGRTAETTDDAGSTLPRLHRAVEPDRNHLTDRPERHGMVSAPAAVIAELAGMLASPAQRPDQPVRHPEAADPMPRGRSADGEAGHPVADARASEVHQQPMHRDRPPVYSVSAPGDAVDAQATTVGMTIAFDLMEAGDIREFRVEHRVGTRLPSTPDGGQSVAGGLGATTADQRRTEVRIPGKPIATGMAGAEPFLTAAEKTPVARLAGPSGIPPAAAHESAEQFVLIGAAASLPVAHAPVARVPTGPLPAAHLPTTPLPAAPRAGAPGQPVPAARPAAASTEMSGGASAELRQAAEPTGLHSVPAPNLPASRQELPVEPVERIAGAGPRRVVVADSTDALTATLTPPSASLGEPLARLTNDGAAHDPGEARNLPKEGEEWQRAAGLADRVTIAVADDDGRQTRIRVAVLGQQVRATIVPPDGDSARQLERRMDDLTAALERHGYVEPKVTVQLAADARSVWTAAGHGGRTETGIPHGTEQPAGDQRQGSGRREQERQGDGQPRHSHGRPRQRDPDDRGR